MTQQSNHTSSSSESNLFETLAPTWWDESGPFGILHKITPFRIEWILKNLPSSSTPLPLMGKRILDVGCGGGLVCEPLCRLGATVTGQDVVEASLEIARNHAAQQNLDITYTSTTLLDMSAQQQVFDIVVSYEVIEHVENPQEYLRQLIQLLSPDGLLILSTLNRTALSYVLGIFVAEKVLRWVPSGTHQWQSFIRPREIQGWLNEAGFTEQNYTGLTYKPLSKRWLWSSHLDVNYFLAASRHKNGIQHLDGVLSSWG